MVDNMKEEKTTSDFKYAKEQINRMRVGDTPVMIQGSSYLGNIFGILFNEISDLKKQMKDNNAHKEKNEYEVWNIIGEFNSSVAHKTNIERRKDRKKERMINIDLSMYEGKQIILRTSNKRTYTINVSEAGSDFLKGQDKYGEECFFSAEDIISIVPVSGLDMSHGRWTSFKDIWNTKTITK